MTAHQRPIKRLLTTTALATLLGAAMIALAPQADAGTIGTGFTPSHIVVVMEENSNYSAVVGNSEMPYFNNTLIAGGLLLTNAHGIQHPSQPNYLDIFSGADQGVTYDTAISGTPFTSNNLAAALIHKGYTFGGYAEGLPSTGSLALTSTTGYYARKHAPWTNWQAVSGNAEPGNSSNTISGSLSMPFSAFPTSDAGFNSLPTVSFVIPNLCNDMHGVSGVYTNGCGFAPAADNFLETQLGAYAAWAKSNNSLLAVTWDENGFPQKPSNHIATVLYGAGITPGSTSNQLVNNYNLLSTFSTYYGLGQIGAAGGSGDGPILAALGSQPTPVPEPGSLLLLGTGLIGLGLVMRKRRKST